MAGIGKRIVGLGAVPSVINTVQGRDALGGTDRWLDNQVFVRPDHPYPIVRMMFWNQSVGGNGGLHVKANGIVHLAIQHADPTKGAGGVKCSDAELIKPNDPDFDPQTCWHNAMDFTDFLHTQQNMCLIRVDHLIGVPKNVETADAMALYSMKIVGIDVDKDTDLPAGWRKAWDDNSDLTPLVRHAIKVKRFDTIRKLKDDGVTFNEGKWKIPANILAHTNAPNLQQAERKHRGEIHQKIVTQVSIWNDLRSMFVNC